MRGIKNRGENKWKRLGVFLVLLLILVVLLNSLSKVYKKKKEVDKALAQMKAEMLKLEERDKFLKESLQKLTTEEGIKFEIHNKLNMAEVGESVAIIVDEKPLTPTSSAEISSWQKIKNFFMELFR